MCGSSSRLLCYSTLMVSSLLSFSLPKITTIRATSSSLAASSTPLTLETLEDKFGRKGFKFVESDKSPVVELTVRNGSSLRLNILDAHVTSYKPKVYWKEGGFEEILHTIPGKEQDTGKTKGGIALVLNDVPEAGPTGLPISSSDWTVKDVDSDSIDALQVELSSSSGTLDLTYVVTLYEVSMATAVIVRNNGRKAVTLTSAILSHLKFKKRGHAGIQGLRNCSYCTYPPLSSPFEILTPSEAMKIESPGLFNFGTEPEEKAGTWKVQELPFTILKNRLSRVYAAPPEERLKPAYQTPPSNYETLDKGRELFFRVIRMGFQDIYVSAPGSSAEKYGEDYFICTGPASMVVPVVVQPGEEWRGAQIIEHDNL